MENINKDGLEDIIDIWNENGQAVARTWLSTGTGFIRGLKSDMGHWADSQYLAIDANKDGFEDIIDIWNENGRAVARTWLSTGGTGEGFIRGLKSDMGHWADSKYLAIDANKDGLEDIIDIWKEGGRVIALTWLSTGGTGAGFIRGPRLDMGHWADSKYLVLNADGKSIKTILYDKIEALENLQKILYNKIEELENNKKAFHIAKAGQADRIIIEKDAHIDRNSVIATELEKCKNIIHNFNPLEGDTISLSHYGQFRADQISFETFQNIKTPTDQISVSGVKISGEENYVACVYGFDADKFFAPDYIDPYTGAPHMLNTHDVVTISQSQNLHGEL